MTNALNSITVNSPHLTGFFGRPESPKSQRNKQKYTKNYKRML